MTEEELRKEAESRILDGKNECYLSVTFGNDVDTFTQMHLDVHCSKAQLILAVLALGIRITRDDVNWIRGAIANSAEPTNVEEMIESAMKAIKQEKDRQVDKEGTKQDSK